MRPSFHPRLINPPFDDPGVIIPFAFENRAILFDLGDLSALSSRDILKVSHGFVTHTHMDHFIGFDRLLRLHLGREKRLCLYGPEGFLENIRGKLAGYAWNLVDNYAERLVLEIAEVSGDRLTVQDFPCSHRFRPLKPPAVVPFSGTLFAEPGFQVEAAVLEHGIPCLGFSLKENFHINIIRERVESLGLAVGPWIAQFKQMLYRSTDPDAMIDIPAGGAGAKRFAIGRLAAEISRISPGMKITYIADVGYNDANCEKIIALAKDTDHLFIEAAFLEKDRHLAAAKHHLTAAQAGQLAHKAQAKRLSVFHFSPRYTGMPERLEAEARQAFASYGESTAQPEGIAR